MFKTRWLALAMAAFSVVFLAGCGDDNPTGVTTLPAAQQFEAVATAGANYINSAAPAAVSANTLNGDMGSYTVIDIRAKADYDAGHIQGAISTSLGTLLDDVATGKVPTNKPIVVACYTGQSAGHATVALRMLGHDAYILLWGMSSWNTTLANKWENSCGDMLPIGDIETTANNLSTTYTWPTWNENVTTGTEAVQARVARMLDGGFKGITIDAMVQNGLDNYFIINYFAPEDYAGTGTAGVPGHIKGAYQFTPKASLGMTQNLQYLPTDKPIVVYCWTGQTASQVAAYLNMLGYEAYDLKFSSNALWYSSLTAHKWSMAQANDFPLVTTPIP